MMYYRVPTCILVRRESCVHIIGKWWWDKLTRCFAKGDKTLRQKKKELEQKGLTNNDFYKELTKRS